MEDIFRVFVWKRSFRAARMKQSYCFIRGSYWGEYFRQSEEDILGIIICKEFIALEI